MASDQQNTLVYRTKSGNLSQRISFLEAPTCRIWPFAKTGVGAPANRDPVRGTVRLPRKHLRCVDGQGSLILAYNQQTDAQSGQCAHPP